MAVKELNIREMRASLGQLAELVAAEGELLIRRRPDHAELRQRMSLFKSSSADLIRAERDER